MTGTSGGGGRLRPGGGRLAVVRRASVGALAVLVVALAAILALGGLSDVSLEGLRGERAALKALVALHPLVSLLAFAGVYTVFIALSVPGALVMTLAAGFLFGPGIGGLAAVASVTGGSVLTYLAALSASGVVARLTSRWAGAVAPLREAVRADAFRVVLSLRLMPAAPIWMINIAAGLAGAPLGPYVLATALGVAPSSFIYAAVGSGLDAAFAAHARLTPQDLLTAPVLAPLGLLAALSAASLAALWRRRRGL